MRVLFVVTGFGYGDTARIKVLLHEMQQRIKDLSIMFMGYGHSYDYFSKKYITLKIKGYSFPDSRMEFKTNRFLIKNFYLPAMWLIDYARYKGIIKKFDPDMIISDFEPVANIIAKRLGKRCISIFGYDPKLFEKYPDKNRRTILQARYIEGIYKKSDLVIVPTFRKKEDYGNVRYVNIIANTSKLEPKEDIMKKLRLKKEPILVMLGGSDYGVELAKKILKLNDKFDEHFIFFGGKKKIPGLHFKFAKNFLEYLKVSKAVITLAGKLTLSECLIFKKPMLVFPIKNHVEQMLNAYAIRNVSVEGNVDDLEESISKLLSNIEELNKKLELLDAKATGAAEVVDIIIEEFKKN